MSNWKLIIDTYNELPPTDRTSVKVHSQLLKQGHSVSIIQVREVLSATVLSDMLSKEDVVITARTLNTIVDIRCGSLGELEPEPSPDDANFAEGLTRPLTSIAGPDASDLIQAMARLVAM